MVVFPCLPLLVVMITTPDAAREPYIAAAEAPFKISILSMSSGFISAILPDGLSCVEVSEPPLAALVTAFKPEEVELLSRNTPSTTYSGCVVPYMDVMPRNFTDTPPPG